MKQKIITMNPQSVCKANEAGRTRDQDVKV